MMLHLEKKACEGGAFGGGKRDEAETSNFKNQQQQEQTRLWYSFVTYSGVSH